MTRRDSGFFAAFLLLAAALFGPLLCRPSRTPGNFGDLYSYHFPMRHLVTSTLQEGRLPLWNPYIFAGTPLAANPQAVLLYPLSALHYVFPLAWAFSAEDFLHVLLGGLGAFLLLRKWRVDSAGAWLLSTAYGLSPFVVCRIAQGIPTHLNALAWSPWIWLAAQSDNPAWLGLTLALQVLSGHPQFSLINLIGLTLYIALRRPAKLAFLLQAGSLALFLGAAQVFPTLEFLGQSVRSVWNPGLAAGYAMKLSYLGTFLCPDILGNPLRGGFPLFPSEFFEMLTNYIGLVPLVLGVYALGRGLPIPRAGGRSGPARAGTLHALAGTGLFFALGQHNPLYSVMQSRLGLAFLRTPSRFSFLILWALWLAAAVGWKRLRPRLPAAAAAVLAAATALDLACWSGRWIYAQDPMRFLAANPAAVARLRRGGGRFATDPDSPTPNKAELYRLYNATGYEAFYLAPIALYTAKSERLPAADGSRTYIRNWHTPEMSKLGVRYYVTTRAVAGYEPVLEQGAAHIYENPDARPLVQGASSWEALSPEHWRMRLETKAPILISQAMYPGWKAWANRRRLRLQVEDGLFPLLPEPAVARSLPWSVNFVFLPESWIAGAWLSAFSLLASGFFLLSRR